MEDDNESPLCATCNDTGEIWAPHPVKDALISNVERYVGPCPDCTLAMKDEEAVAVIKRIGLAEWLDV